MPCEYVQNLLIGRITWQMCWRWRWNCCSCDYAIAAEGADVKLSELAIGIGPFVVGPGS